ncbi:MAG: hypothetical protein EBS86_10365 [Crocinitomicaceae bacterium]|nr:hypothetical protein [Crocinitomicaceae bacterium]
MKDKTSVVLAVGVAAFAVGLIARFLLQKREGFEQEEVGAPVGGDMSGLYSGIDITKGYEAPVSQQGYNVADDQEIFQFQKSTFKPECCPSGITNDVGCLCYTDEEAKKMAYRGGNRLSLNAGVSI